MKNTLFINGSPNKDGNTVGMAKRLLGDAAYDRIDLVDYKIYPLGQKFDDDQFDVVWNAMKAADTIIWGTPDYWYDVSSLLKNLIDRAYDFAYGDDLRGKHFIFLMQGAGPTQLTIDNTHYLATRFAELYGMELVGYACGMDEADALASSIDL